MVVVVVVSSVSIVSVVGVGVKLKLMIKVEAKSQLSLRGANGVAQSLFLFPLPTALGVEIQRSCLDFITTCEDRKSSENPP